MKTQYREISKENGVILWLQLHPGYSTVALPIEGKVQPYRDIPSHPKTGTKERNQVLGDCPDAPNLLNAFIPMSNTVHFQKIKPLSP